MQVSCEKVKVQNTTLFHHRKLSFCFVNTFSSSVLPHVHSEFLLPECPVSTFSLFKTDFRYVTRKLGQVSTNSLPGTEIFTGVFNISVIGEVLTNPPVTYSTQDCASTVH